MTSRASMLVAGVVLAGVTLVGLAGCSSSTDPAGAGQDDVEALSSAAVSGAPASSGSPAGASVGPSVGPSVAPMETPPPPDSLGASAAASSAGPPAYADVCDPGLTYACGDIGPGGGTVFYASATAFACGPDLASTCNFLEAAPNLWNPTSQSKCTGSPCGGSSQVTSDFSGTGKGITYCTSGGQTSSIPGAMGSAVGTGYANTTALLAVCNSYDAGPVARAYAGGGLTDWSLPSDQELFALYQYPNRASIGGFNSGLYWSSTGVLQECADLDAPAASVAVGVSMGGSTGGETLCDTKKKANGVRPVRAF